MSECKYAPHRGPEGPNEDVAVCLICWGVSHMMRPENEQYGLHDDDCSLPRRHRGRCVGGGSGHAPTEIVRGYWPGMDAEVAAARARFEPAPDAPRAARTEGPVSERCCLDDQRDHTPLGCTRCGCLTPIWIAGERYAAPRPDVESPREDRRGQA